MLQIISQEVFMLSFFCSVEYYEHTDDKDMQIDCDFNLIYFIT
jgi:hypothetical protein